MNDSHGQGDLFSPGAATDPLQRRADEQERALHAPSDSHLRIVAGPGAGKTHVLVGRVVHLIDQGCPAHEIALVTYTNSARTEMESRIAQALGQRCADRFPQLGTIHQFCLRLVGRDPGSAGLAQGPRMLDPQSAERVFTVTSGQAHSGREQSLMQSLSLAVDRYDGRGPFPLSGRQLGLWSGFESVLKRGGLATFTSIQLWALAVIEAGRIDLPSHLLVDEFQDSSGLQVRVLEALAQKGVWITVVGDADQSIFRFSGGDPGLLPAFHERFKPCVTRELAANGRSTRPLVQLAAGLRRGMAQFAIETGGQRPELIHLDNEQQQASFVAEEIGRLCDSKAEDACRPEDIAILCREGQPAELISALEHRGIPLWLARSDQFEAKPHVRDLIVALEVLADPDDEQAAFFFFDQLLHGPPKTWLQVARYLEQGSSLVQAARSALDQLARPRQAAIRQLLESCELLDQISGLDTLVEQTRAIHERLLAPRAGLRWRLQAGEMEADLERITDLALSCSGAFDLAAKLRQGVLSGSGESGGVSVGTMHWAKGREWPVVFALDLTRGVLPHRRAEDVGEERRLLFVAVSRAGRALTLCAPERLPGRGEGACPWLRDLAPLCRIRDLRGQSV